MASAHPSHSQSPAAPFAISMRRRTILACSNCRKRKIRCITTEQPPKNPCARCTKKGLSCEYVAAPDVEEHSSSRPQTPDTHGAHRSDARASSGPSSVPPGMPRGPPPALPYTGPPPMTRTGTGWGYVPSSSQGPNYRGSLPSANPRSSTPGPGSNQPYAHHQYYAPAQAAAQYAPGYANPQYSQHQYNVAPGYASQPPSMQQSGDHGFDYSEFLNDYDGAAGHRSSGYHSNNPRYN
ncbi:hypothetical protein FB451DRAFT_1452594 [Mycena latifolia]|nr:hypothetical protein FB451DRAFT_1452594 [Mycena latifolia]